MGDNVVSAITWQIDVASTGLEEMLEATSEWKGNLEAATGDMGLIKKAAGDIIKKFEMSVDIAEMMVDQADALYRAFGNDQKMLGKVKDLLTEAGEASRRLLDYSKDNPLEFATPGQLNRISRVVSSVDTLSKRIEKATAASNEWDRALQAVGLEKFNDRAAKFMTIGGQVGFWGGMFAENARQAGIWQDQNYALYGSLQGVRSQVAAIKMQVGPALQKDVEAATKALADMSIDPGTFNEAGVAVTKFNVATGVSAQTAARFYKQMQALGAGNKQITAQFNTMARTMSQYGLTAKDADGMTAFFADNIRLLNGRMGSMDGANKAQQGMMMVGGMAKSVGMEISDLEQIYKTLMTDALQYITLLGDGINLNDPSAQFLTMAQNADTAVASLKDAGFMQDSLARSIYGMPYKQLKEMRDIYEKFAISKGFKNAAELTKAMADPALRANLEKELEAMRAEQNPMQAFNALLENMRNLMVDVIDPIVQGTAAFVKWAQALLAANPWLQGTIKVVGGIIGIITGLVFAFVLVGGAVGMVRNAFHNLTGTVSQVAQKMKAPGLVASLRELGRGLRSFFTQMAKVDLKGVLKTAAVMIILGGALIILGYAAQFVPPGKLIEMGASLIAFAAAMWVFSKITGNATKSIMQSIVPLLLLGLVLGVLAVALYFIDPGKAIAISFAILLLAVALAVMGAIGQAAAVGIVIAAAGLVIIAVAMILASVAFLIFAKALKTLEGVNILWIGVQLLGLGVMMVPAAALLIAAGALLLAATVVLGLAAIPFFIACIFIGLGLGILSLAVPSMAAIAPQIMQLSAALGVLALGVAALAVMVAPAILAVIAAALIATALGSLFSAFQSDGAKQMNSMAGTLQPAMVGLVAGMWAIVDSPYIRFPVAAYGVAKGLRAILGSMQGISVAKEIPSMLNSLARLASFTADTSGLERTALRMAGALHMIGGAIMWARFAGLDQVLKTSAMMTVKTELEDKKREAHDREKQYELLTAIRDRLDILHNDIIKVGSGGGGGKLDDIKRLLEIYMPEIAENDTGRGLSSATNSWNGGGM